MNYTIGQLSEMMNISTYTLRYYEKEGLLPFVKRNSNGIRVFDESDFEFLHVIHCLKKTGMSIKEIRTFIDWTKEGDASIQKRHDMFLERKREVDKQIAELELYRECIEFKCGYYQKALEAGSEDVHRNSDGPESKMPLGNLTKFNNRRNP
ncbi:MerR family transcriptional regulator [Paenibacillus thalictri]|uniref:MerR family transcriptional regulator n=1 Tax=Paenibacillus thalictri TaxID=2527873 RepID=A0A4Q9DH29_9BACL|nr:MerR family transcriptional regulator [Paenibacillus thalictri]TBL69929.1 MerR family transcriptional regulator [Paenibacillus thalictri]